MADAPRSEPMLHPSRGGGGRPHEGHAQARRELQRSYLEARRIENKRPKISCASEPAAQFCELERGTLAPLCHWSRHWAAHRDRSYLGSLSCMSTSGLQKLGKNQPQGLSYGRAGGFLKVMEATARFMRPAGHGAALRGLPSSKSIVPWPCFKVTVPLLPVTVTSPLSTMTP
jgi:hypothetical protein